MLARLSLVVVLCTSIVGVVNAAPKKSLAESKEAARSEYDEGLKNYNLGEYQLALSHFKEAYRNYAEPSFLFNLGQCERQLGLKADAIRSYRAFLRSAKPGNRAEVEQILFSLERAVAEENDAKAKMPVGMMTPTPNDPNRVGEVKPAERPNTLGVTAPPPAPVVDVIVAPGSEAPQRPIYKKGWFWGVIVGVVVVAGVGVGVGVALSPKKTIYPATGPANGSFNF